MAENATENRISRRQFIFLGGKNPKEGITRWASVFFGAIISKNPVISYLSDKLSEMGYPDVEIPKPQREKIKQTDKLLSKLRNKVLPDIKVEIKIPDLNSESFHPIMLAKLLSYPKFRKGIMAKPEDFKVWLEDSNNYNYPFNQHKLEITGGNKNIREIARSILDTFVKREQWRISSITLSDHNANMENYDNTVSWEAGTYPTENDFFQEPNKLGVYKAFLHELTHATTPFRPFRMESPTNKIVVLPYGLGHSVDFINEWLTVINSDFDFFKERYLKEEHETFNFLKNGDVGRFVDEAVAMLVADYVFPEPGVVENLQSGKLEDPYKNYPAIEQMIRKTLAYVQYGTRSLETYPDGVPSRRESNYQDGVYIMR